MITKKKNECPKCGKVYILPGSLKTHLLSHANDNKCTCSECLMTFTTKAELEGHVPCHSKAFDENTIKLSINNRSVKQIAKNKAYLNENKIQEAAKKDEIGSSLKELVGIYQKLLKCTRCPLTFISRNDLENHLSSHLDDFFPRLSGFGASEVITEKHVSVRNQKCYAKNNATFKLLIDKDNDFQLPVSDNSSLCRSGCSLHFKSKESSVDSDKISKISLDNNVCVESKNFSSEKIVKFNESLISKTHSKGQDIIDRPDGAHQHVSVQSKCSTDEYKSRTSGTSDNSSMSMCFSASEENMLNNDICLPKSENCDIESRKGIFSKLLSECNILSGQTEDIDLNGVYSSLLINFPSLIESKLALDSDGSLHSVETDTASDYCTLFKCLMCPMIFLGKEDIDKHLHMHKEEFKIENKILNEGKEVTEKIDSIKENSYSSNKNEKSVILRFRGNLYKIHLKKVYIRYYKCLKCPLVFLSKLEVQRHVSAHVQDVDVIENNVSCDDDSLEFSKNFSKTKESKNLSTVYCPIFHCLKCEIICLSNGEFESHLSQHDEEVPPKLITEVEDTSSGKADTSSDNGAYNIFYSCPKCGKNFKNRKKYMDHKQIHVIKRFECKECGKTCRSHLYLKKHMKLHLLPYKCTKCSKSFKSDYVLELHQSTHSDVMPYECKECGNVFRNKISLTLHSYEHLTSGPFNCEICKECFENSDLLKAHMQTHIKENSGEEKSFTCSKCDQTYSDRKSLQQHLQSHALKRTFKCKFCSQFFKDRYLLVKHLVIHRNEKRPYQCSICQKNFSIKSSLTSHLDTHSSDKQYLCHICGISLNQRSSYYTHMRKHTGVVNLQCDICGKRFFHKGSFKRHISMHYGRKPYQCESCGKSFKQRAHLEGHLVTHTGDKPHKCKICQKCFTQRSSLKVHQLTHSSGQYMCPDCGRPFTQKSTLLNHLKKDRSGKSYCCDLCMKMFIRRTCYLHHKRTHHLQGTCVIEFDGNKEIIETYVDSVVDEVKEIIITQADTCETGEEIIETQATNVEEHNAEEIPQSYNESDTVVLDSNEAQILLIGSDSQAHEFGSLVTQEFDFSSHIMQAFGFSFPNSQVSNFDVQEIPFSNENSSFAASSHVSHVFETKPQEGDVVTSSTPEAQSLPFNLLYPQNLAFDLKDTQSFTFALPESELLQKTQAVISAIPGNESLLDPLPFDEREEIVVTQDDKKRDNETMQVHFVF